jgi:hypothetical protein
MFPRSGHADVGEEQHRHALQMTGVRARPDDTDDQVRSANNQRDTPIVT